MPEMAEVRDTWKPYTEKWMLKAKAEWFNTVVGAGDIVNKASRGFLVDAKALADYRVHAPAGVGPDNEMTQRIAGGESEGAYVLYTTGNVW